jgi:hypothetical protein
VNHRQVYVAMVAFLVVVTIVGLALSRDEDRGHDTGSDQVVQIIQRECGSMPKGGLYVYTDYFPPSDRYGEDRKVGYWLHTVTFDSGQILHVRYNDYGISNVLECPRG